MSTSTTSATDRTGHATHDRRVSTETKASYKTTEFIAYLAVVVAIAIGSQTVGSDNGTGDYFRADKAFLFIVIVTVGYMVSRGLAKSGSRQFYDDTIDLDRHR